jgi:nitrite reductase (NADH) small subunit
MGNTAFAAAVALGSLDSIPVGQGRCFIVGSDEIAVFRQRDGRLFAVQNRCPHREGPLSEGLLGNNTVICPLHSQKFDLESGKGQDNPQCLRVFPVDVRDRQVIINAAGKLFIKRDTSP